ncbi:MAG: hypothetical protein ACKVWR_20850 [Acidimicrobiales bacterium]
MTEHNAPHPFVLVTAGAGKTGRRVAQRLHALGVDHRVASRAGHPPFDWNAPHTWPAALDGVTAVYLAYSPDRSISYVPVTLDENAAVARQHGGPAELVELLARVLDGRNAHLDNGAQRALGREPRDFTAFAIEAAASGAWTRTHERAS